MKLHIYAQNDYHNDAVIVGDREALTRLRDLLDRHLKVSMPDGDEFYARDGEGYTVIVETLTDTCFEMTKLPYTNREYDFSSPTHGITAYEAVGANTYTRIHKQVRERNDK